MIPFPFASVLSHVVPTPSCAHPDGKRVATSAGPDQASSVQDHVVFVFNFGDYLRTIPPGNK